jgi:hypothetical protein
MHKITRRLLAGAAGVGLTAGLGLTALPAEATHGPVTITRNCEDAGHVPYTVTVKFNYLYRDPAGVLRVSINPMVVKRPDGTAAEDAGVDLRLRVYSGTTKIQDRVWDGLDLDFAAPNQATFNPRNPRSVPGVSRVLVTVGTDGDGLGNCPVQWFTQPAGLDTRA